MGPKKKGGQKKGQTLNLNEFLGNEGGGAYRPPGSGGTATVTVASNWADEMEEEGYEPRKEAVVVLPTAPRAALGPGIDDERIPHRGPFTAYIANLPYDVEEEEIMETFEKAKLKIENVRLMKDEGGRLKGYGYADFSDRNSLVDVLTMELSVKNRRMRIDLASQAGQDRPQRGGFDNDRGGDRRRQEDDPNAGRADADGEWRRGPPPPARDDGRDRGGYNGRDSSDRDRGDRYNGRDSYDRDRGDRGGRGFSNYEPARDRGGDRDSGRYGGDRDSGRYGGFSRGDRDGGGGYSRGGDRDERREPPKERPRLQLAARSKPVEDEDKEAGGSSIFGGAKPVDTLKKEQEMEEKLKKEKEEKEKAREEARKNKPSAASIFGGAKPVDTTQREKEIEEKLSKMTTSEEADKKEDDSQPKAYRPPGRRDDGERRKDDRGYDRRDDRGDDRRMDRGGYDRRDNRDRRDDRGTYDRRDDRRDDRGGYDRRDDRGGYDRRDDRRDDRGGYDRRDDRGGYDRRDDRGGYDRRDDREGSEKKDADGENNDRKKTPEPPVMKKYEEPKPANVVAQNKFAFLQEEDADGGSDDN